MKIVFLDFDGVLNNRAFLMAQDGLSRVNNCFDPDNVRWLNWLTDESGARIVVSSSWRYFNLDLRGVLKDAGVSGTVIGETPEVPNVVRGMEIGMWLRENAGVMSFVILDDDEDMGYISDHLVRTTFESGLTEELAYQALRVLCPEREP